jgi:hypothetical protein
MYLAIGLEKIPKVLCPGNKLNKERRKVLTEEEECPYTTILF